MADETILIDIEFESNAAEEEKQIDDLTASIEGLKVMQSQLDAEVKKGNVTQVEASKQKAKISTQLQTENKQRKDLIKIVQSETGSRDKMRLGINKLIKERDALNTNTVEGKKKSEELRVKIDELTAAQKESGVAVQAQTANIGNYNDGLKDTSKGAGSFITGMKGMIKSSLAFIATPLGAAIAAIVGVFKLLQKAFQRSEGSMNKVRVLTGKLSGVFNLLMKGLEPVVAFIIDNVIATFDALGKAVDATMGFVSRALKKIGFDQAAESVENFSNKLKEASAAGEALADAQNKLNNALRFAQKTQLDFQKLAERQRQIRDDEAISIEERIAANIKLGEVLKQQMATELSLANQGLKVAEMRIALEGDSTANLDARAEALTNIADIQERVEAQASEQLVNTNSLIRDQTALRVEAAEKLKASKDEAFLSDQELTAFENELELEQIEEQNEAKLEMEQQQLDALTEANGKAQEAQTLKTAEEAAKRKALISQSIEAVGNIANQTAQFMQDVEQNRLNNDLAALDRKQQTALLLAGNDANARARIEAKFEKDKLKLQQAAAKKQKKIAIGLAIINGSLAILKAFSQLGPIAGGIASVLIAITTGFQIAKINQQQFKRGGNVPLAKRGAKFGTFDGASHAGGGTNIINGRTGRPIANVERDENFYVVNKHASAFLNGISDVNQRVGGGVSLTGTSTHSKMARGGQAEVETSQPGIDINTITKQVIQNMPPIVVQTVDIKTGLEDRNDVLNVGVI